MRLSFGIQSSLVVTVCLWAAVAGAQSGARAEAMSNLGTLRATQRALQLQREALETEAWREGIRARTNDTAAIEQARAVGELDAMSWQNEEERRVLDETRFRENTRTLSPTDGASRREAQRQEQRLRVDEAARRRAQEDMGHGAGTIAVSASSNDDEDEDGLPRVPESELSDDDFSAVFTEERVSATKPRAQGRTGIPMLGNGEAAELLDSPQRLFETSPDRLTPPRSGRVAPTPGRAAERVVSPTSTRAVSRGVTSNVVAPSKGQSLTSQRANVKSVRQGAPSGTVRTHAKSARGARRAAQPVGSQQRLAKRG